MHPSVWQVNTKVQRRYCILHKGYLSWFKKEPTKDFCDAIDSGWRDANRKECAVGESTCWQLLVLRADGDN
jgi:hypothetical protein